MENKQWKKLLHENNINESKGVTQKQFEDALKTIRKALVYNIRMNQGDRSRVQQALTDLAQKEFTQ